MTWRMTRLEKTPLGEVGLAEIGQIKSLQVVRLRGASVTAKALIALRTLPRLLKIDVRETGITREEARQLQALLPRRTWIRLDTP